MGEVVDAGALPVTLGGDHSITEPCIAAIAERRGPVGLIHFDTHTDTGREVFGVEHSHGTPMYRLVEAGRVARRDATRRSVCAATGRGRPSSSGSVEHGIASFFMHDVRDDGIREVVERALAHVGEGPVYVTVDVDVLDPAFAPGTGTPEPGGMTSVDLLWAVREIAVARRARRRRRRRGAADGGRLGGHHRARRRARRARAADGSRAAARRRS